MSAENIHLDYPETADIETSSDDYARRFSGEVGRWFLALQESVTLDMLRDTPGGTVLDVGGGHGQLTKGLLANGYRVTVLGSSEVCKRRIQELLDEDHCRFQTGNILALPYEDRSFDAVVSYRLLPHVDRWQEFLAELARVARKTVIIDCPTSRSLNALSPLLFGMKKRWEGNTRPFTLFRESVVVDALRSSGFARTERCPQFFLPMVLHRALGTPALSKRTEALFRLSGLTFLFGSPVILKFARVEEARRQ